MRRTTAWRAATSLIPLSLVATLTTAGLLALAGAVSAEEEAGEGDEAAKKERLETLESQMEVLAGEIERLRTTISVPEDRELESFYGLGAYASKVYTKDKGLSIGGYGEIRFRGFVGDGSDGKDDIYDALRAVLYVGYKFNDRFVLNSEFEFEHANSGGGSVSVEFLTLDFLWEDEINLRGGLLLIPMGLVNEQHEPVFFNGMERPEVERRIIPSTWRENGAGVFGQLFDRVTYRMYAVAGFDGSGFTSAGLRGGRQKGSKSLANDWAFVGRFDVDTLPGLQLGGSAYVGNSGQDQEGCADLMLDDECMNPRELPSALTTIYEFHAVYRNRGLTLKGLFTQAFVNDAGELSYLLGLRETDEGIADVMLGGYGEIAYDFMPLLREDTQMSLEPFFRYEYVNTQWEVPQNYVANGDLDQDIYVVGIGFKPIPQVVLKVDYRHFEPRTGVKANEVQFGFGYAF